MSRDNEPSSRSPPSPGLARASLVGSYQRTQNKAWSLACAGLQLLSAGHLLKDDDPKAFPFKVNTFYPDKEPLSTVPPNVLQTLPPLPEEIEYRFIQKHLILRDARANLIIDYIPNAIS